MTIWKQKVSLDFLNQRLTNSMCDHLGIKITRIGDDYLEGSMPVNSHTMQPRNILHGGASVVLAESLGSIAGCMCVELPAYCVGMEINANHLASVSSGQIIGRASPIHLGRRSQVWDIRLLGEDNRLICISRLTLAVKEK